MCRSRGWFFIVGARAFNRPVTAAVRLAAAGRALSAVMILSFAAFAPRADAATPIVGAVSVTSPQGDSGGTFALTNTINQTGLSALYVSGVTDFATFTASTTHDGLVGTGFTTEESNGPQQFTFDLGTPKPIDGIVIWNTTSVGRITSFNLFSDVDPIFGNGTSAQLLPVTVIGNGGGLGYVFSFAQTNTRYIHVNGTNSLEPPDFYGLGEVAFRAVPEPVTLAMSICAVLVLPAVRLRRRS